MTDAMELWAFVSGVYVMAYCVCCVGRAVVSRVR